MSESSPSESSLSESIASETRGTPDDLAERWRSMVMLWKSGLDPDGMQAMLATVDFSAGEPGFQPGVRVSGLENFRALSVEYVAAVFLARLANERGLAERIRYGTVTLDNHLVTFGDTPWKDQVASWLIPWIAGHPTAFAYSPAPPGTPDEDIAYVAGLIFRCLRSPRSGAVDPEALLKLLFSLPRTFELDPLALTATVLFDPELITKVPELRNADIYQPYLVLLRGVVPEADGEKMAGEVEHGQALLRKLVQPLRLLP